MLTKFSELFQPAISGFAPKQSESTQRRKSDFKRLHPNRRKTHRSELFHYSNPLDHIYRTKKLAQGLIQRYKSCYSQRGVIQEHSGRKRLVGKKRCMIRNIANPLLAPALLPDMFCNKNNAISLDVGVYRQACSGIPLAVGFVGRDRWLWNSMVQGPQGFRQVRAASCVIPYVLCGGLYCLRCR